MNSRSMWNIDTRASKPDCLVIRDTGHNMSVPSVTNDIENVVADLVAAGTLKGRKLMYVDSSGELDEIVVKNGKFAGFRPGPARV